MMRSTLARTTVVAAAVSGLLLAAAIPAATAAPGEPPTDAAGAANPVGVEASDVDAIDRDTATCGSITIPDSLAGFRPGDLVGSESITPGTDKQGNPLLTGARSWRILYVSTGIDETQTELVCGLVSAPDDWTPDSGDARGRIIAWDHGTTGLIQSCQPSASPDTGFFGPTPGGIGAVAWSELTAYETTGLASKGILQTLIDEGYVVAATDYYAGIVPGGGGKQGAYQHYAAGVPSGANVLDSVRAAIALADPDGAAGRWDMLTWGHSQGGGSALWSAQLARKYFAQTTPTTPVAPIRLVGVAAEAPATQFTVPTTAPQQWQGSHLGDLDMHNAVPFGAINLAIGPALFSYVLPNWAQLSTQTPAAGAKFPARPGSGALDMSWMLATKTAALNNAGMDTAPLMAQQCLGKSGDLGTIYLIVRPYINNPVKNFFFVEEIWGRASEDYKKGYLDYTCATTSDAGIKSWCRWLRYNMPGPNGTNPFDKIPRNENGPVPMYLMQGMGDDIIYCMGEANSEVPPDKTSCLARQFFQSNRPAYCPTRGQARGSLQLDLFAVRTSDGWKHPSTHLSLPGQVASNPALKGGNPDVNVPNPDLDFADSPLHTFMDAAFHNPSALPQGCTENVIW